MKIKESQCDVDDDFEDVKMAAHGGADGARMAGTIGA